MVKKCFLAEVNIFFAIHLSETAEVYHQGRIKSQLVTWNNSTMGDSSSNVTKKRKLLNQ